MKNIFNHTEAAEVVARLEKLDINTKALWGKMNVAQMLAHCNVPYEMVYEEEKHPKPNAFVKLIMKLFVKDTVVGDKPYKKNSQTAPAFLIKEERDFELEKKRLIEYVHKTLQLGESYFDGKESHAFGTLTKAQWNTMFAKHLDHHFGQFGV